MEAREITALAVDRIKVVDADGSACALCGRPIRTGRVMSVGVKLPIVGVKTKHFCPVPCTEILLLRMMEIRNELAK